MPVPCVDLMIHNPRGEVLLVKRGHTPARNLWWFPGGRVLYREPRRDAVVRKLAQECGLVPVSIEELGTHDLQLERDDGIGMAHSITTVYRVRVAGSQVVQLDFQSQAACWQSVNLWLAANLHPFIQRCFTLYRQDDHD